MTLILCNECGKEISDSASSCPNCGAPIVKYIYCRKCGTKLQENTEFCHNCGLKQNSCSNSNNHVEKDKLVTALLALFLGYLGIHYFYLGKGTAGIVTIILTLCSCGIWSVVIFIQAIFILMLSDEEFNKKFVTTEKTFPIF